MILLRAPAGSLITTRVTRMVDLFKPYMGHMKCSLEICIALMNCKLSRGQILCTALPRPTQPRFFSQPGPTEFMYAVRSTNYGVHEGKAADVDITIMRCEYAKFKSSHHSLS